MQLGRNFFFLILVAVVPLALDACGSAGEPEIQLSATEVDLGVMSNGTVEEFTVQVSNTGSSPLLIEAVTTSCGCTSASVTPETIQPGQSGELNVRYDSGAHGPEFAGEVQRQVFISSNDPDSREVVLNLQAMVTEPEASSPDDG